MTNADYEKVVSFCNKFYSKKDEAHASRVVNYVLHDPRYLLMSDPQQWLTMCVAYAHDLIEDTNIKWADIDNLDITQKDEFLRNVMILTHHAKDESYMQYIERVCAQVSIIPILVKTADMADHWMQKDTLTLARIEKYTPAIKMLLEQKR